jgi:chemotaxis protein MotB
MHLRKLFLVVGALAALALLNGCATKKYVKQEVSTTQSDLSKRIDQEASKRGDLSNQVQELASLNKRNSGRIDEVESNLSKSISGLDPKIEDAKRTGLEARSTADAALASSKENSTAILNRNNYTVTGTESVFFKSGSARLDDAGKSTLDGVAKTIAGNKNLLLELQGFTDSVGDAAANLRLSERRVDTVLRYLVADLKVDLFRIAKLGLGEANPAESNKTRDGRAKNRRVEVRVLGVK